MRKVNCLFVGSHADDIEVGGGGTAARLVREGAEVDFLLVSNLSRIKDISRRMGEALAASKILGANLVTIDLQEGNYRDIPRAELVERLDVFFSRKPYRRVFVPCHRDSHQDHQFVSNVLFSVCRKNTADLLIYEPAIPSGIIPDSMGWNYFMDISGEIKQKIQAMRCHQSQLQSYGPGWLTATIARSRFWGQKFGWQFAEAFSAVKILV